MPQFDTFSFFSQLFWVFLAFTYLYLSLCLYLLPAFAAVLKIRAKKLSQMGKVNTSSDTIILNRSNCVYSKFVILYDTFINVEMFCVQNFRQTLNTSMNNPSHLVFKNEPYYQFNFLILNQFKTMTFFV